MKIPLEFGGTWFESLAPRAPFDAEIVGLLFGSAAVFISYEKSAFLGLPGVSVTLSHGWMVGLYFMFSLLLSMIFTKKIASSPLVMWFELSMFVRYGWAFGTRVLKTRVPERTFWVNPFFQWYKVNLFPGPGHWNLFPPNKKGFWELLWAQNGVWSHQKVDLPNSGSFFGWSKKGSGLTRLVGQVSFPSRILFFSERKKILPLSQILS